MYSIASHGHLVEDRTFRALIKRYAQQRNWGAVEAMVRAYGDVLEQRGFGKTVRHTHWEART